ncbi:hypothetical protein RHEC894_PC00111 (plasmid) [Rhizobium sp. CIAT894]|uniref:hypothetical protein n=1 Tax=Rhizobium sp. CIAT894 TaxID=2020312 RepID=UPI000A1E87B9|nr:hypothetical protein [Rhizobium sp. CIAT894]ARM91146.1 hypothetical protein RHEC894_PC00111 [Rhizobium sp. CIAT894]
MDILQLIKTAKIGIERKAAQTETCAPFAAALHDVLAENGVETNLAVACRKGYRSDRTWYHLVVEHNGQYYDSLGEFSSDILRKRLRIHHSVQFELEFKQEPRDGCYEEADYDMLHSFLLHAFRRAASKINAQVQC